MANEVMLTNREVEAQIQEVYLRWDADTTLHLFTNDFTPDPTHETADFTEASYTGYAAVNLAGDWSSPVKSAEGIWSMHTLLIEFEPPASGDPQTVYGAWIDDGTEVVAGMLFPEPVVMEVGGESLVVRVTYKQYAALVLIELVTGP